MTSQASPAAEFDQLERDVVDHFFVLQPGYAVFLGLHQYDGRVPDLSRAGTDAWVVQADRLLARVRAVSTDRLSPARAIDRSLLELLLESPRFDLVDSRDLERNPMSYVGGISLTQYMVRDYAPVADRTNAIVATLEGAPKLIEDGARRLDPTIAKPFLTLTLAIGGGLASHFAEAEAFARKESTALGDRVKSARETAEASVTEFLDRIRTEWMPRSNDEFALGAERYQKLLWVREGIRTPFDEIRRSGEADLARNQARLEAIAGPTRRPAELFETLFLDHPAAADLIPTAQRLVDETKRFVLENDLVTIPEPSVCRVEETPTYGRALSTASMNPPGPFDVGGDEGIYYVTPVDSAWPAPRQEEWLRSLNRVMLKNITVHEVWPGHYLQFLHFRHAHGSLTRKVYLSPSFTEGWAHYCEQLAIEAGIGGSDWKAEVAQIHDALLRDCRLIASIGLHTGGMTLAEATKLFVEKSHFEQLPAEREAIRGTFNPEYFCYTLGKLRILEARRNLLDPVFHGSRKAFHDRLLSTGAPPVGLLETLLQAPP
ncbi:MAG TPA: DUF885 domain-containing protein [Thermoplasmata archaeon]|jgi:hypothetical protein|nr:DUF885 domain-containing protein [Thermoplasmata archaeon]